ncbi:hypothetical protein CDAR_587141 [Caerostris darwini]|uniref:Uncharacterized protein n=1 Tax=Caerostris darwini TaxID=1538125 RepID=A0AAV4SY83_9ARAC|nr:hypothetical protein CDAR_587141 [Caerostris darwini]
MQCKPPTAFYIGHRILDMLISKTLESFDGCSEICSSEQRTMFGDRSEASGPMDFNVLQVFHLIHLVIRPDREIVFSPKMDMTVYVDYLMEFMWIFQIN